MKKLLCIIVFLLTVDVGHSQLISTGTFGQLLNLGHWSTDGLVFYWRGIKAGNAVDESLYRNHGTIMGATWTPEGLDFTNATDHIKINDAKGPTTSGTAIWRIREDAFVSGGGDFIGKNSNGDYAIYIYNSSGANNIRMLGYNTATGLVIDINLAAMRSVDGTWQTFAATWESGAFGRLYKNGKLIGEDAVVAGTLRLIDDIWIGGTGAAALDGRMSSCIYYNRALSANEIQQLYINPDLPMQQDPIWLMYSPAEPSGIVPIIQAHNRRRRAG